MTPILDEVDPEENLVVEFDFTGEIVPQSVAVSVTPINRADPDAANMLIGSAQISGASVFQRIKPNLAGVNYKLRCVATQGEDVRVRAAVLPVRQA